MAGDVGVHSGVARRAADLAGNGRYAEAIRLAEPEFAIRPSTELATVVAHAYLDSVGWRKAEKVWERAMAQWPGDVDVVTLGVQIARQRNPRLAWRRAKPLKLVALSDPYSAYLLGSVAAGRNQLGEARKWLTVLRSVDPVGKYVRYLDVEIEVAFLHRTSTIARRMLGRKSHAADVVNGLLKEDPFDTYAHALAERVIGISGGSAKVTAPEQVLAHTSARARLGDTSAKRQMREGLLNVGTTVRLFFAALAATMFFGVVSIGAQTWWISYLWLIPWTGYFAWLTRATVRAEAVLPKGGLSRARRVLALDRLIGATVLLAGCAARAGGGDVSFGDLFDPTLWFREYSPHPREVRNVVGQVVTVRPSDEYDVVVTYHLAVSVMLAIAAIYVDGIRRLVRINR